jgi:hypothetical protein
LEIEELTAEDLLNEAYLGYRIGDCISQPKWCNWQGQDQQDLGYIYPYTARRFPDSLVGELFRKHGEGFYQLKPAERVSQLARLVHKRHSQANTHDLVIHLRLGDVKNEYDYLQYIDKMIEHGWHGSDVVLVAGFHYRFAPVLVDRSLGRIQTLAKALIERGYKVQIRSTTPDDDLVFMSQSNWLITGYRGYAQLAYDICRGNKIYCDENKMFFADQTSSFVSGFGISSTALTSAETNHARKKLEAEAITYGGVSKIVKTSTSDILETDTYCLNEQVFQSGNGALKPLCILKALKRAETGDVVFFHDIHPQGSRNNGNWITRSIEPVRNFCAANNGIAAGVALPQYGPNRIWTKRDCFILMDCDSEKYWNHPQISCRFSMWQATDDVIRFVEEWLDYCLDPRIFCDQDNVMGKNNLPGFRQHRFEQSILTNLVIKNNIHTYTPRHGPAATKARVSDINFLAKQIEFDKLMKSRQPSLSSIGTRYGVDKVTSKYVRTYEYWLEEIRNKAGCILEKGLGNGQVLNMWRDYFSKSEINGVDQFKNWARNFENSEDKLDYCKQNDVNPSRVVLHGIKPEDRGQIKRLCQQLSSRDKAFNLIVDSGTTTTRDQQLFMGIFFKMLTPGGLYAIENLQRAENPMDAMERGAELEYTTLDLVRDLARNKIVESPYLTKEENNQLNQQVRNASITWHHNHKRCIAIIEKEFD